MQINKTQMKLMDIGGYTRKPTRWNELGNPVPLELLMELKQYTSTDLGIDKTLAKTFRVTPPDTVFLVAHEGGLYLINTEGAEYARYVRYIGCVMPPKKDVVELHDEHHQPIEILTIQGKFYWIFDAWSDETAQDVNGPYDTRDEAIDCAEDYKDWMR